MGHENSKRRLEFNLGKALESWDKSTQNEISKEKKNLEDRIIVKPKAKKHWFLRYAIPAALGFVSVGGGAVGLIAAVAGVTGLTAVGWPVLVPVLLSALFIGAVGAVVYNRLKSRQEKIQEKIELATAQVSGISEYLAESVKDATQSLTDIKTYKSHKEETSKEIVSDHLKKYQKDFDSCSLRNAANLTEITKVEADSNDIHNFNLLDLTNRALDLTNRAKEQKKEGKEIITDLEKLQRRVGELVISPDPIFKQYEDEKTALSNRIQAMIGQAKLGQETLLRNLGVLNQIRTDEEKFKETVSDRLRLYRENFMDCLVRYTDNLTGINRSAGELHFHSLDFHKLTKQAGDQSREEMDIIVHLKELQLEVVKLAIPLDPIFKQHQNERAVLLDQIQTLINKAELGQEAIIKNLKALDRHKNDPNLSEPAKYLEKDLNLGQSKDISESTTPLEKNLNLGQSKDIGAFPQEHKDHH